MPMFSGVGTILSERASFNADPWPKAAQQRRCAMSNAKYRSPLWGRDARALRVMSFDRAYFLENAVHRVDVSDDRRTAESLLSIQAHEVPDVLMELAKSKRLSIVMGNLNRLLRHPPDHDLGRRALRHLGFLDD